MLSVFRTDPDNPASNAIHPFEHQTESIRITVIEGKNLIVATGRGSGKSFCFGIPIINTCLQLRKDGVPGVKAIIIYPMNALANSQYDDFAGRLEGTGLKIARYTGEVPHSPEDALRQFIDLYGRDPHDSEVIPRREIQQNPPYILITNYFIGNDPQMWYTNVPSYAKVRYKDFYEGVGDLLYYGNQRQLKYDFTATKKMLILR